MIAELHNAWLIHKKWISDSSIRLVFFTEEHGLVPCFYKAGRSRKKQALLESFIPTWLSIKNLGEAYCIHKIESQGGPIFLSEPGLLAGLYLNELVQYALKPLDAHQEVYTAYSKTLSSMCDIKDRMTIEKILRRFEQVLLCACGYGVVFTEETLSGAPIIESQYYSFVAGQGFFWAKQGIPGAYLMAIARDELEDTRVLAAAKYIMRRAIAHALDGKTIRARALYRLSL